MKGRLTAAELVTPWVTATKSNRVRIEFGATGIALMLTTRDALVLADRLVDATEKGPTHGNP
ncbi:hypothetical protein ROP_39920 [Rhodococcus opacus B4]|uniref:Uncharacterized protein n=1 Tax=Rhodococcus opacus (strain B4) TaxID=632772 RepID=C1B986_RHOOB|nr:hypothetical protein ROP_39920 [Rhodococcus opacus B4]